MSTELYIGSGKADQWGYVEQPARKSWNPEAGWQTIRTWWGPRANEDAFISGKGFVSLAGIEIEYDGDIAKIALTLISVTNNGYDDPSLVTQKDPYFVGWTLSGNSIQAEIAAMNGFGVFPRSASDTTYLGAALHSKILAMQRKWKADIDAAIAAQTYPNTTAGTEFNLYSYMNQITDSDPHRQGRARYLFLQQVNKNDIFETSQPVLRKHMTLRNVSEVKVGMQYVGRMFSWSALRIHESTLDAATILAVDTLDAASTDYSYIWRKRMPVMEISNDGKRIITQEYWAYEAYDYHLYGGIITSSGSTLVVPTFPDFGGTDSFLQFNSLT